MTYRLMQASEDRKGNLLQYVKASVLYGSQSDRATQFLRARQKPAMSPGGGSSPEQPAQKIKNT